MLNTKVIISNSLNGKLLTSTDKEGALKMTSSARIGAQEALKKHRNDNDMDKTTKRLTIVAWAQIRDTGETLETGSFEPSTNLTE